MTGGRPGPQRNPDPTPFQVELLIMVAQGCTDAEISASVRRSRHAVQEALRSVYRKLHARNRAHAVVIALRRGIIDLPPADPSTEETPHAHD